MFPKNDKLKTYLALLRLSRLVDKSNSAFVIQSCFIIFILLQASDASNILQFL